MDQRAWFLPLVLLEFDVVRSHLEPLDACYLISTAEFHLDQYSHLSVHQEQSTSQEEEH